MSEKKKKKGKVFKIIKFVIIILLLVALIGGIAFGGFALFDCIGKGVNSGLSGCNGCNPSEEEQFEFGMFPQSIKADDVTISGSPDADGYYTGSDDEKYAKVVANPYTGEYSFSDDSSVVAGETYYFKLEPIVWKVVRLEDDGTAFIVCDTVLTASTFCDGTSCASNCNNYKNSLVREWLNDEFLDSFTSDELARILSTEVSNAKTSTADWDGTGHDNPYVCENTNDKVFLLSYVEAFKSHNYLEFDVPDRGRKASDFAVANGVELGANNTTSYWLRSPESVDAQTVSIVGNHSAGGDSLQSALPSTKHAHHTAGVLPAMWVTMD